MKTRLLFLIVALAPGIVLAEAAADTMKAIAITSYGGVDVLKETTMPRPVPKDDEMLVRVFAAGVNPVDAKVRAGSFGKGALDKPLVLGFDISGVVEKVGAKVTRFKTGDAVFAYVDLQRGGAYAEYAIVKQNEAAPKPKSITHEQAAAVPLAALTAWQALIDTGKLAAGQTAFIQGGSGGVGSFAIQIAKARGAKVIATASTANQDFLKELGADQPIDYTKAKFEEVAKDVDVALDAVGTETLARSYGIVKKGGTIVSILAPPDRAELQKRGIRGAAILVKPNAEQLAEISTLIDANQIKPVVSQTFPLADAAKAHQQIESGHTRGKIVLKIAD